MDDVIFEELKGTGNMEVRLDRELAEQRVYPAIHIPQSGTRNDDRLYHPDELVRVQEIRRHLASLPIGEAIGTLLQNLARTKTTLAQAQLSLVFQDIKNFKMVGPNESEYEGGSWDIGVFDGSVGVLGCIANFGFAYTTPNIACPSGTTGLLTQGDLDGDGVRDLGLYVSVSQPIPARQVEPFRTGLVELFAAPPSRLPRPLGGFNWEDNSIVIFYDLINDPVNGVGYELTSYTSSRPYLPNQLRRHRDEIVPGTYTFQFPALGSDEIDRSNLFINAPHREMVEAVPGPGGQGVVSGGISVGNDFRLLNDDRWNNGVMELDPRLIFDFEWEGFNSQTFLSGDRIFFSVRDRETDKILFPPIPNPNPPGDNPPNPELPQLIGSNFLGIPTGYELGPDFFRPDQEFMVELEFRRNLPSGNSVDQSRRFFRWDVDLIDTYEGFSRENFPAGTNDLLVRAGADYDGDGFTNLEEFGLQTDVLDPASVPNPAPTLDPDTGQCILEVPKRPGTGSRLETIIQYSLDLVTWISIVPGDPNWFILQNDEEVISVLSLLALSGGAFGQSAANFLSSPGVSSGTLQSSQTGQPTDLVLCTFELCELDENGRMKISPVAAGSTAAIVSQASVPNANKYLVFYPAKELRNPNARRILRNRYLITLKDGADIDAVKARCGIHSMELVRAGSNLVLCEEESAGKVLAQLSNVITDPDVEAAEPLFARKRFKKEIPTDPFYDTVGNPRDDGNYQWYLNNEGVNGGVAGIDIKIESAFDRSRGKGTTSRIAVVDDGVAIDHLDLAANAQAGPHLNLLDGDPDDPTTLDETQNHGTNVAGLIAAAYNNTEGIAGVAPRAGLSGIRLLGDAVDDADEALALSFQPNVIDIYNNSWGPDDETLDFEGPGTLTIAAMRAGAETGRAMGNNRLGNIYVWAAGNGGEIGDNSNYDGYANSIYSIA
eukprot:snap_masked-scaffold7154_size3354-processed-gene-0.0 protein:Tk10337 transcript:snap_masked-scaffold7154_size3354-processed-gene-0.0-mRNA-1 annotation:"proprotein convertase subtilisin kexin type 4"